MHYDERKNEIINTNQKHETIKRLWKRTEPIRNGKNPVLSVYYNKNQLSNRYILSAYEKLPSYTKKMRSMKHIEMISSFEWFKQKKINKAMLLKVGPVLNKKAKQISNSLRDTDFICFIVLSTF